MEDSGQEHKALLICGGVPGGCTYEMCDAAAEALLSAGYDVDQVLPSEMDIAHCTGCQECAGGAGCVIDDDMGLIYHLFTECEGVILATPLRFSGPSSIIKAVMDRMQVYWDSPDIPRPKWMAMLACSGSDNPDFSHLRSIMRAFSITLGMEWRGEVYVTGTDSGRDHIKKVTEESMARLFPPEQRRGR